MTATFSPGHRSGMAQCTALLMDRWTDRQTTNIQHHCAIIMFSNAINVVEARDIKPQGVVLLGTGSLGAIQKVAPSVARNGVLCGCIVQCLCFYTSFWPAFSGAHIEYDFALMTCAYRQYFKDNSKQYLALIEG